MTKCPDCPQLPGGHSAIARVSQRVLKLWIKLPMSAICDTRALLDCKDKSLVQTSHASLGTRTSASCLQIPRA